MSRACGFRAPLFWRILGPIVLVHLCVGVASRSSVSQWISGPLKSLPFPQESHTSSILLPHPLGCKRVAVLRHFNRCRAPSHDLPPGAARAAHRAKGVHLWWGQGPGACCHSCGQLQMLLGQRSGVGQEQAVPVQPLPSAAMQEWVTKHTPHGPQDTFLNCPWSSDIAPACQASFSPPPITARHKSGQAQESFCPKRAKWALQAVLPPVQWLHPTTGYTPPAWQSAC